MGAADGDPRGNSATFVAIPLSAGL
jgi:hypothetical protein